MSLSKREIFILSSAMCKALKRCHESHGELSRHEFTGDAYGRFYVHPDDCASAGANVRWSVSVPTVKALKIRGLLNIVSYSGDLHNPKTFRPEFLTLTPQGRAMANVANEFGPSKMPDCFIVETDGSVVYGMLDEVENYLKNGDVVEQKTR